MGIETAAEYGGAESSFTAAIITIEGASRESPRRTTLTSHRTRKGRRFRLGPLRRKSASEQALANADHDTTGPQHARRHAHAQVRFGDLAEEIPATAQRVQGALAVGVCAYVDVHAQLGSFCLSEPASGSDAFALKTRATKEKDGYVINGSKMWITNSREADLFIVFANLDPSKGYKGISAFMVEREHGLEVAKKEIKVRLQHCACARR